MEILILKQCCFYRTIPGLFHPLFCRARGGDQHRPRTSTRDYYLPSWKTLFSTPLRRRQSISLKCNCLATQKKIMRCYKGEDGDLDGPRTSDVVDGGSHISLMKTTSSNNRHSRINRLKADYLPLERYFNEFLQCWRSHWSLFYKERSIQGGLAWIFDKSARKHFACCMMVALEIL